MRTSAAIVTFESEHSARYAIQNPIAIQGYKVKIDEFKSSTMGESKPMKLKEPRNEREVAGKNDVVQNAIFVKGIPKDYTEDDIQNLFSRFGGVFWVHMKSFRKEFETRCASVYFSNPKSAYHALKFGLRVDFNIKIEPLKKTSEVNSKKLNTKKEVKIEKDENEYVIIPKAVVAKHLPIQITEEELRQHFGRFGMISDVKLEQKGPHRSYAIINFKTEGSVDLALGSGVTIRDSRLRLEKQMVPKDRWKEKKFEESEETDFNKPISFHEPETHFLYFLGFLRYFSVTEDKSMNLCISHILRTLSMKAEIDQEYISAIKHLARKATEGILAEGRAIGQSDEAQKLVSKLADLSNSISSSLKEIFSEAVHIYTVESFLYRTVNLKLRQRRDLWNVAAYCLLLSAAISGYRYTGKVYRGMKLNEEVLANYSEGNLRYFAWTSFTSMSKDKKVSEGFGNTLFEIEIEGSDNNLWEAALAMDVGSCSQFAHEQEVLLSAGAVFELIAHDVVPETNRHIIKARVVVGRAWSINGYAKQIAIKKEFSGCSYLAQESVQDQTIGTIASDLLIEPEKFKGVHLLYGNITKIGISKFVKIFGSTSILWLNLGFNKICDAGIAILMKGLEGSSVNYLDIKANYFSDKGAFSIADALPKTNISILDLGNNRLTDIGITELFKSFPKAQKLFELFASLLNITDETIRKITPSLEKSNLNKLYLGTNLISDIGVHKLCSGINKINYLHLNNNQVTDEGIEFLAQVLPSMVIKVLNLHMNKITDQAMQILGEALSKNKEIFTLDLSYNLMTKDGVLDLLMNIGNRSRLKKLNLQYNQIHGEDKKELQDLCNSKKVEFIIHKHS